MSNSIQHTDLGIKHFSFAVVADSHLNQDEAQCNSPFAVNRLANGRMRYVVRDINTKTIDFVIHLGDLIHPVPAVKDLYLEAARRFLKQIEELQVPIYLTPGNHDIGDKPMPWAPAGVVTDDYVNLWQETFGDHYYSFDHKDCHFVVINSQLLNSGLTSEQRQKEWLEHDLTANTGKRIFLSTHYPPFLCEENEEEHYDNIAEPERSWLLDLIAKSQVEMLFGGHVHNFWYLKHETTNHYLLPSTAFVRQDYSEMFKAPPAKDEYEAGRNDAAKLGYFVVHVYENGHVCQMVRTYGECIVPGTPIGETLTKVEPISPRENHHASLGFDLRQSWAEKVGIPPSGGLDEFDRKEVRNDYPLLALWEMGVQKLRIPMQDLRKASTRERIRDLQQLGHSFTLFSFNLPSDADHSLVMENTDLLSGWEVGFRLEELDSLAPGLSSLKKDTDFPIYLSRMWGHDDNISPDGQYYHVMNHGFTVGDERRISNICNNELLKNIGIVFRVMKENRPFEVVNFAGRIGEKFDIPATVHLRMAGYNPAIPTRDDQWVSRHIAEGLMSSVIQENVSVFVDTLTDIDRGYFVRNGVLDEICNPRQGALMLRNLYGALNISAAPFTEGGQIETGIGSWIWGKQSTGKIALFLPAFSKKEMKVLPPETLFPGNRTCKQIDLISGVICPKTSGSFTCSGDSMYMFLDKE